jgi:hypothetical protein
MDLESSEAAYLVILGHGADEALFDLPGAQFDDIGFLGAPAIGARRRTRARPSWW